MIVFLFPVFLDEHGGEPMRNALGMYFLWAEFMAGVRGEDDSKR
jgi:hypothetical protein